MQIIISWVDDGTVPFVLYLIICVHISPVHLSDDHECRMQSISVRLQTPHTFEWNSSLRQMRGGYQGILYNLYVTLLSAAASQTRVFNLISKSRAFTHFSIERFLGIP